MDRSSTGQDEAPARLAAGQALKVVDKWLRGKSEGRTVYHRASPAGLIWGEVSLSTIVSEKVSLRPFMRELCLLLCGLFLDLADSKKNMCYDWVKK